MGNRRHYKQSIKLQLNMGSRKLAVLIPNKQFLNFSGAVNGIILQTNNCSNSSLVLEVVCQSSDDYSINEL